MAGFDSGNSNYTRRTHIVRVYDSTVDGFDPKNPSGNYVDVEVLDSIGFRTQDGEVIIDCSAIGNG